MYFQFSHLIQKVWAQRADGKAFSRDELDTFTMSLSAEVEWNDGRRHVVTPYQLFRRRKPQKHKYLWKLAFNLPLQLKNLSASQRSGIKKVSLQSKLEYSYEAKVESRTLLLLPPGRQEKSPQLQITTSTKVKYLNGGKTYAGHV